MRYPATALAVDRRRQSSAAIWPSLLASVGLLLVSCAAFAEDNGRPARPVSARFGERVAKYLLTWEDRKHDGDGDKDGEKNGDKNGDKDGDKNGDKDDDKDDDDDKDKSPRDEPLESDRPDFTESTSTVGKGVIQFEGGYTYTRCPDGKPSLNDHTLPELLIRYGLAERLEMRCEWEGVVWTRPDRGTTSSETQTGCTDADFGFKYALTQQDKWRPATSIIVAVTAPCGSPTLSNQQVGAVVNYLYSWKLGEKFSLAGSTSHSWASEPDDWFSYIGQSLSLQYEFNERFGVFNEFYALFRRESQDNGVQCYYDGGLTYHVTKNFQLDWRAGCGLTSSSDRFFTGCGLTIRK
jgi:hypothetical protein